MLAYQIKLYAHIINSWDIEGKNKQQIKTVLKPWVQFH